MTLASGLDAIVQVIEPYLSRRANPVVDALCEKAIPDGLAALRILMEREDGVARDRMALTSLTGGVALANSGLGAVHGLAGAIGGATGAAHGAICGALLPHVLRANRDALGRSPRMDRVIGWIAAEHGDLDGLERWIHASGLPRLSALGLDRADHRGVVAASRTASSMRANPVDLTDNALIAVLESAG